MGSQVNHDGFLRSDGKQRKLPKALRRTENVGLCGGLWIDVDVDREPTKDCYRSVEEMETAITSFLASAGILTPNMGVNGGRGGQHLYWLFDRPISLEEWKPLAKALANAAEKHGFKIDGQCTVDACHLLRIPDTCNFKTNPPSPVTFAWDDPQTYTVERIREMLKPYMTVEGENRCGGTTHTVGTPQGGGG